MDEDFFDENVVNLGAEREQRKQRGRPKKPQQQHDKDDDAQELLEAAREWVTENCIRECLKQGCYFVKKKNGTWIPIKRNNFPSHFPEWSNKFAKAVTFVMAEQGLTYLDATHTFAQCPDDTFNMLSAENWLKPTQGDYHWLFDVLMRSLSGNKAENCDHLEWVLTYKYLHPEAYTLPAVLIHGEGGVGKNLLVDVVLWTLFAGQTYSGEATNVIGDFNGIVKGRAAVMIDEAEADTTNAARLKHRVQAARFTVNDKNIAQYEIDNTPLYFIASNKSEGGVWLDRSQADRRYSVLHVKKGQSLAYWVALHVGGIPADKKYLDKSDPVHKECEKWLINEGAKILADPAEIANWLGALIAKYGEREHPLALHGADFDRLMEIQKPMHERIFEAVFHDPDFEHIERAVLHQGYVYLCQQDGQRGYLKQGKFYEKLRDWVDHLNEKRDRQGEQRLIETQVRVREKEMLEVRERRPHVWIAEGMVQRGGIGQHQHGSTRHRYLGERGYKTVWIGPEV